MSFLISINCAMLYGAWAFFIALSPWRRTTLAGRIAAVVTFLGSTVIGGAVFLPVASPHLGLQRFLPGLLLAGAIVTGAGCGYIVSGIRHNRARSYFHDLSLAAILGCVYLAFTAYDHLRFFDEPKNTGYLDASVAEEAGISCPHGFVLVRLDPPRREASYRCPSNVVFGDPLQQPFVPWPAYREGSSPELFRTIQRLHASSRETR